MFGYVSRGKGYLSPLLILLSVILMMPAREIGVTTSQTLVVVWLLASGAWVLFYGLRSLRGASEILGRPLHPSEWVLDLAFLKPRPFHSFMFIQLPWWSIAHVLTAGWVLKIMLAAKG